MGSYFCAIFDKNALDKTIDEIWTVGFEGDLAKDKEDFMAFSITP